MAREAAAVRFEIQKRQKQLADENLSQLRYIIDVSQDVPADSIVEDSIKRSVAEEAQPNWHEYDPLNRSERVHRYPITTAHSALLSTVTTLLTMISDYMQKIIEMRRFPTSVEDALGDLAEISNESLVRSPHKCDFHHFAYPSLKFTAHQMLVANSFEVKLFVIVVNEHLPYDYFFYFF